MKKLFQKSLLFNLLLIALLLSLLLFILFSSLNTITKHGQDAKVPNVLGKKLAMGQKELVGFELHIDSIYMPYKDPLEIIFQDPLPGNVVKKGRIIFLTVNKQSPPTIDMPPLVNMSFRNAVLTLQSYRLIMGDTIFKPDIAAGAVLEQLYKGRPIAAGMQVPVGSQIDLVVGAGLSDSTMDVPDLIGKNFATVKSILDGAGILYNVVWDGAISDSNNAVIYNQQPESKNELDFINSITPGDMIDIRVMQSPSAELLRMNQAGSRKFVDPNDTNAPVSYGPATNELPHSNENIDENGNPISTTEIEKKQKPKKPLSTQEEIDLIKAEVKKESIEPKAKDLIKEDKKGTDTKKPSDDKKAKDPKSKEVKKPKDIPVKNKDDNDFSNEFK